MQSVGLDQEDIEARLFLLEAGSAVFLDVDAKAIVIDLEEDGESQVKRLPVTDIEPGMFILLRTSGGGDYIISLANRILGEEAQRLRGLQKLWKIRLRNAVTSTGSQAVNKNLVKLGSQLAKNELNVRNWMSDSSIKPRNYMDFDAILRFVGLGDRVKEFHEAACLLDGAHRSAGKYIRKLLIHQVCSSDLHELKQLGRMDFELDEVDGGIMTVFRVVDIAPELNMILASKIAQPFEL